jgi:hypothetical protein
MHRGFIKSNSKFLQAQLLQILKGRPVLLSLRVVTPSTNVEMSCYPILRYRRDGPSSEVIASYPKVPKVPKVPRIANVVPFRMMYRGRRRVESG